MRIPGTVKYIERWQTGSIDSIYFYLCSTVPCLPVAMADKCVWLITTKLIEKNVANCTIFVIRWLVVVPVSDRLRVARHSYMPDGVSRRSVARSCRSAVAFQRFPLTLVWFLFVLVVVRGHKKFCLVVFTYFPIGRTFSIGDSCRFNVNYVSSTL